MKKKNLEIGIIVILVSMLFILTGCGKKEENQNLNEKIEQMNSENKDSQEKTEIAVSKILAISENYAVVTGADNSTYIIDKNGDKEGTIPYNKGYVLINKNGYVIVKTDMKNQTIYDKTGKEILESTEKVQYEFGITDSDLLIRKTLETSFSGNTSKREVIDIKENVKYEIEDEEINTCEYVGNDIFAIVYSNGVTTNVKFLYDVKNNQKIEDVQYNLKSDSKIDTVYVDVMSSDYTDWKYKIRRKNNNILELTSSYEMNNNNQIFYLDTYDKILSDNSYYDGTKKAICGNDGNTIKDLSEGNGASNIGYYDNKYCIQSSTGYYYVLDENFNRIIEPTEMHVYDINYYGIMSRDSENTHTIVYDYELNNKKELSYKLKREPDFFVAEIEKSNNSVSEYFNLNTQEKLVIYI